MTGQICPRCGQSPIVCMEISTTKEPLLVCDECEATWFPPTIPNREAFNSLGDVLRERGLPPLWSELASIEDA